MKKIFFLCVWVMATLSLQAQDAKSVFVNMPDSLSSLLTKVNRADFADFLESKMKAQVKNKLDNMSEMKILTKDFLFLQTTSQSTFQLKLLATSDTTKIIGVVTTVCGPVCDSRIQFFTTEWTELPLTDFITLPTADDFLQASDSLSTEEYANARNDIDVSLIQADLSADNNLLIFTFTTPSYLSKPTAEAVKPFLKEQPLAYVWKAGKFIKR